ncbi:MAG: biotin transporter BioY [Candidatus Omnitrophica bacterium]|nr:biotin transporter BioY [Candidatus Omnitrophota bacterium]
MSGTYAISNKRELVGDRRFSAVIGVLFFIMATALGAYVRIPVHGSPVPITLQTFFVILSAAVLGKRLGLFSQLGYLALGMAGLPLFQGVTCGFPYLFTVTGGYLVGFILAAYFIGRSLATDNLGILRIAVTFTIGSLIILASGAIWLVCLFKIDAMKAISMGILPFIPGDVVKIFFAVIIYSKISKRAKAIFGS